MKNLKVYYIYHSCFAVETENYLLVFDYFKEPSINSKEQISLEKIISNTNKKIFFFSSHSHHDHFNEKILYFKNKVNKIQYVLSSDITLSDENKKYLNNESLDFFFLKEGDFIKIDSLEITAYGSSDLGISFLVKVDNITLFHAGDLNWWYWKDDTKEEEEYMKNLYQGIVDKIKLNIKIDLAFFPVDPRLEEFSFLGVEYFAQNVKPSIMIPMHFDENFHISKEFKDRISKFNVKGVTIKENNSLLFEI